MYDDKPSEKPNRVPSDALETICDFVAERVFEASTTIAHVIEASLMLPNDESDRKNLENTNVVDGLFAITRGLEHVATTLDGLFAIARGLDHVAEALEQFNPKEKK